MNEACPAVRPGALPGTQYDEQGALVPNQSMIDRMPEKTCRRILGAEAEHMTSVQVTEPVTP